MRGEEWQASAFLAAATMGTCLCPLGWVFVSRFILLAVFCAWFARQDDVARVGHEPHRLPQEEHGVEADNGIADDCGRPDEADNPEAHGQHGGMAAVGIVPLIHEAEGEYHLSGAAQYHQPGRDAVVSEKLVYEGRYVFQHKSDGHDGQQRHDEPQHRRHATPHVLDVEIPNINVIGDKLPQDDGEVAAQPAVDVEQNAPYQTEYPEHVGRQHLAGTFGEYPLHKEPAGEKSLSQKADGVYQRIAHRLVASI